MDFLVRLESELPTSYRTQRAADSLDIDIGEKSVHELKIKGADVDSDFSVGVIVGSSGSGKTTLANHIYGKDCFKEYLDLSSPIIDQFPKELGYDECAKILNSVGLTSVPCWIRPAYTLSNGQRARAEAAIAMVIGENVVIDEWTSVVDRTVAKVMSHCVQKFARREKKSVVLVSCHYDVIDWLQPDWVIDCNKATFENRRSLRQARKEQLEFNIAETERTSWKFFSKYHYLSSRLPGGKIYTYGLFHNGEQVGFQCFANYIPTRKGKMPIYHSNRTVIHPDYAGLGLGLKMINACSKLLREKYGYEIRATFSSIPLYKARMKDKVNWKLTKVARVVGKTRNSKMPVKKSYTFNRLNNTKSFRSNVKIFTFKYIGHLAN